MTSSEMSFIASRLCSQCGLCCNGVTFHSVKLQPADSAKELTALGLRLKRKQRGNFILQPCPAFQNSRCSIYAARPERCRLFECRQLHRVAAGEISETMALEKIHEAQSRIDEINELLRQAGTTNLKHPLSKRCEKAMAELIAPASDQTVAALQSRLARASRELNTLLNEDFRMEPIEVSSAPDTSMQ